MANEEHAAILKQGVEAWNQWRRKNPGVRPDLRGAILRKRNLTRADLTRAELEGADLERANLEGATLYKANLQEASLRGAMLFRSTFQGADLQGVNLRRATLQEANLRETVLTLAVFGATILAGLNLRHAHGLNLTRHDSPSTIGIDTVYRSGGNIPESFLRGCGVPDSMIEYAHALVAAQRPIDYYSCFISYADADRALAERLYADLQAKGVRCWYAPHDLEIGEPILNGLDRGIRLHDKLLLILSAASVASAWIEQEVQMALARERTERRRVLFPIRIDNSVSAQTAGWPALVWSQRHVGDFCQWKDHDAYQAAFGRVLRDLKATPDR